MDFAPPTLFLYCYRFAYSHLEVEGQPLVLDDYVIYKPTEDFPVELVSRVHSIYGFEDIFYSLRFGYATFFSRLYFPLLLFKHFHLVGNLSCPCHIRLVCNLARPFLLVDVNHLGLETLYLEHHLLPTVIFLLPQRVENILFQYLFD